MFYNSDVSLMLFNNYCQAFNVFSEIFGEIKQITYLSGSDLWSNGYLFNNKLLVRPKLEGRYNLEYQS